MMHKKEVRYLIFFSMWNIATVYDRGQKIWRKDYHCVILDLYGSLCVDIDCVNEKIPDLKWSTFIINNARNTYNLR